MHIPCEHQPHTLVHFAPCMCILPNKCLSGMDLKYCDTCYITSPVVIYTWTQQSQRDHDTCKTTIEVFLALQLMPCSERLHVPLHQGHVHPAKPIWFGLALLKVHEIARQAGLSDNNSVAMQQQLIAWQSCNCRKYKDHHKLNVYISHD